MSRSGSLSVPWKPLPLALVLTPAAALGAEFHGPPFDDLMGNHIDTHLESRFELDRGGAPVSMTGRLYVIPVDEDGDGRTDRTEDGLEIWRHPRGPEQGEDCDVIDCRVGWNVRGWSAEAVFLSHSGVNGNDHPQWLVPRSAIPQPGAPSHFHWISAPDTTDPRGPAQPDACNVERAGQLEGDVMTDASVEAIGDVAGAGMDQIATWSEETVHVALDETPPTGASAFDAGAEGITCQGWILELRPVGKAFAFRHAGDLLPVAPSGFDVRTHLNLQSNYALVPGIEGGGAGGGHGD